MFAVDFTATGNVITQGSANMLIVTPMAKRELPAELFFVDVGSLKATQKGLNPFTMYYRSAGVLPWELQQHLDELLRGLKMFITAQFWEGITKEFISYQPRNRLDLLIDSVMII